MLGAVLRLGLAGGRMATTGYGTDGVRYGPKKASTSYFMYTASVRAQVKEENPEVRAAARLLFCGFGAGGVGAPAGLPAGGMEQWEAGGYRFRRTCGRSDILPKLSLLLSVCRPLPRR